MRRLSRLFRLAIVAALLVVLAPSVPARSARPVSATAPYRGPVPDGIDRLEFIRERASRAADAERNLQVRPAPGPITGRFGELRRGHAHKGIDINGKTGDPVVAAALGTVVHAGSAPKGYSGYGDIVMIDHGEFQTIYAHLSRIDVVEGQVVRAGDNIGAIGTTGSVTGSHLHFEVHVAGKAVDPKTVFGFFG